MISITVLCCIFAGRFALRTRMLPCRRPDNDPLRKRGRRRAREPQDSRHTDTPRSRGIKPPSTPVHHCFWCAYRRRAGRREPRGAGPRAEENLRWRRRARPRRPRHRGRADSRGGRAGRRGEDHPAQPPARPGHRGQRQPGNPRHGSLRHAARAGIRRPGQRHRLRRRPRPVPVADRPGEPVRAGPAARARQAGGERRGGPGPGRAHRRRRRQGPRLLPRDAPAARDRRRPADQAAAARARRARRRPGPGGPRPRAGHPHPARGRRGHRRAVRPPDRRPGRAVLRSHRPGGRAGHLLRPPGHAYRRRARTWTGPHIEGTDPA